MDPGPGPANYTRPLSVTLPPMAALQIPEHFPPKAAWKRFFIGVRWLGPDLSFFKAMKTEQGQRLNFDVEPIEWIDKRHASLKPWSS